jgi:hypothetical protein
MRRPSNSSPFVACPPRSKISSFGCLLVQPETEFYGAGTFTTNSLCQYSPSFTPINVTNAK